MTFLLQEGLFVDAMAHDAVRDWETWYALHLPTQRLAVISETAAPGMGGNADAEHYCDHRAEYLDVPRLIDDAARAAEDSAWVSSLPAEVQRALAGQATRLYDPSVHHGASRRWVVKRCYGLFRHRHTHRFETFRPLAEHWLSSQDLRWRWQPPRFTSTPALRLPAPRPVPWPVPRGSG